MFNKWITVKDTGKTIYQINQKGERRVTQRPGGYQPIDTYWLETGQWTPSPSRPKAPPCEVVWRP